MKWYDLFPIGILSNSWTPLKAAPDSSISNAPPAPDKLVKDPSDRLGADLDISTKGIKVSSSVLGVIVLVISMAFLYMYLDKVYPITPTDANRGGLRAVPSGASKQ